MRSHHEGRSDEGGIAMSEQQSYKIIRDKHHDIVIPFICYECDECHLFFPWSTLDENCPGYRELQAVYQALYRRGCELVEPEDYPIESIRAVPDYRWLIVWSKFLKANPSEEMILKFAEMNGVRDQYVRPYIRSKRGLDVLNQLKKIQR